MAKLETDGLQELPHRVQCVHRILSDLSLSFRRHLHYNVRIKNRALERLLRDLAVCIRQGILGREWTTAIHQPSRLLLLLWRRREYRADSVDPSNKHNSILDDDLLWYSGGSECESDNRARK